MSKINKKVLLWHIVIYVLGHALSFALRVLHQMKGLIKLHNRDKFLEDSSFGSNFRDLQKLA